MAPDPPGIPADLLGSMIEFAHGRMADARRSCAQSDRTAVLHALHQLKGMCVHTGDEVLVRRVHAVEARATAAADIEMIASVLASGLPPIGAALEALDPHRTLPRTRELTDVIHPVLAEARRVAGRRGIALTLVPPRRSFALPARTAMMLVDLLGHLVRNAVVHGSGDGAVTVAIDVTVGDGGLVCSVENTGRLRDEPPDPGVDTGRGLALTAVADQVRRAGGRFEHGRTDGGYAARIRLPESWCEPARPSNHSEKSPFTH